MTSLRNKIKDLNLTQELIAKGIGLLQQPRVVYKQGEAHDAPPAIVVDEDKNHVALRATYEAERSIAKHIARLLAASVAALDVDTDKLWTGCGFTPDQLQRDAVDLVVRSQVVIITGGPGTGKTTIVQTARKALSRAGAILQMCPTGKAAQRLTEQTGAPSTTIHRALGYAPGGEPVHAADNPWDAGVVIIDEASMIDVHLMAKTLAAIPTGARVVIIGDVDQLPSCDAGAVLRDLIDSGVAPTVKLEKIYRQASESRIPYVARGINHGQLPDDLEGIGTDFRFIERGTDYESCKDEEERQRRMETRRQDIINLVLLAVTKGIPEQKGIPAEDCQVLAPQKSKGVGVERLNFELQKTLNPQRDEKLDIYIGGGCGYVARTGDKVMHVENNYALMVFNGEVGRVVDANRSGVDMDKWPAARTSEEAEREARAKARGEFDFDMGADFDGGGDRDLKKKYLLVVEFNNGTRQVAYTAGEARELVLGYAVTIHKSQGSQFPANIMVCDWEHQFMLTRQLVYTGVTRAEKYMLVIGQRKSLQRASENTRGAKRRTELQELLKTTTADTGSSLDLLRTAGDDS